MTKSPKVLGVVAENEVVFCEKAVLCPKKPFRKSSPNPWLVFDCQHFKSLPAHFQRRYVVTVSSPSSLRYFLAVDHFHVVFS